MFIFRDPDATVDSWLSYYSGRYYSVVPSLFRRGHLVPMDYNFIPIYIPMTCAEQLYTKRQGAK